jgi:hypothetical protein
VRRLIVVLSALLLLTASCGDDDGAGTPVTTEPAPERDATQQTIAEEAAAGLPTPACDAAFARAAATDPAGSVDDLDAAARDCISLDDWIAADASHPAALDGADPVTAVGDACQADDDLAGTPLCEEVLG